MDKVIFTNISMEELEDKLSFIVEDKINNLLLSPSLKISNKQGGYATRIEVAGRLRISLPTLHNLTKRGILKAYRINRRVLYKWEEIEYSLQTIETTRYKRKDLLQNGHSI